MVSLRDFIYKFPKTQCPQDAIDFANTLDGIWVSEEVRDAQLRYVKLLFDYAQRWRDLFADYKREKHLIDYNDMEALFLKLLNMPEVAANIPRNTNTCLLMNFRTHHQSKCVSSIGCQK